MKSASAQQPDGINSFRKKLLVAMMLVVCTVTGLVLYVAQRNAAADVENDLQREFQSELAALHSAQEVRQAALTERCRALVGKPRIHAALEDNAIDLLYPSARDELRDVMPPVESEATEPVARVLDARFYRFLDASGAVIPAPDAKDIGELTPDEEAMLSLKAVPERQQIGYLRRKADGGDGAISEIIAMPIISTETGEIIAALVLGFDPVEPGSHNGLGMKSGIWLEDSLYPPSLAKSPRLTAAVAHEINAPGESESRSRVEIEGVAHLMFHKRLNPGSMFPAAHEVCLYPLNELLARQRHIRWQVLGTGALLLLGGLAASHFLSGRLSVPVEKLAVVSEVNRAQRQRAEAALESTSVELQRAARFSADASHQLKTPVTVLRAGLEELLAKNHLPADEREEVSALIHQTYRLSGIMEDLLLLSRMDAGRLRLDLAPVNLSHLIEASVDDLSAQPDGLGLEVETGFPPDTHIAGEKRYTSLILQNLLENARKYNLPGGRIRITARMENGSVVLTIGNTGRGIPEPAQAHIFERFHRGSIGENVPGHGLGLNLARELARLHHGDLRLARSDESWTEFEVVFRIAQPTAVCELEHA